MNQKKKYPLNQSPLFKLKTKRKLATLLGVDTQLLNILATGSSYNEFLNNKNREVQYPVGVLARVHKILARYLSSIEMANFITSKSGSSYIQNAKLHVGQIPLIKTDISKFYPSTSFGFIMRMFLEKFQCASDVAWILAKICSYKGKHLPTGSHISGYIAYFANQDLFKKIEALTKAHNCTLTCYVDDIVISGEKANPSLLKKVRYIITRHGYSTKDKKSVHYTANQPKRVTGCIIRGNDILLPNSRHHKIKLLRDARNFEKSKERIKLIDRELQGRVNEANQVLSA